MAAKAAETDVGRGAFLPMTLFIGTAGWSIPKPHAAEFPADGTHLQRYASRFSAVEINSSFYRSHKPATYARWAASVPAGFRFAVKVPRQITHVRKLVATTEAVDRFLSEVQALGDTLGPLLVQLPPSLGFQDALAGTFFDLVRTRFDGAVVCEPRHASWFTDAANALLERFRIARVAADPAPVPPAAQPGGWSGLVYRRLHGSVAWAVRHRLIVLALTLMAFSSNIVFFMLPEAVLRSSHTARNPTPASASNDGEQGCRKSVVRIPAEFSPRGPARLKLRRNK